MSLSRLSGPRWRSRGFPLAAGVLGAALLVPQLHGSAPAAAIAEETAVFDGAVLDEVSEPLGALAARRPPTQVRAVATLPSPGKAATSAVRPLWARMPNLTLGATGAAVLTVQKRLSVKPTSFFGPLTRGAVLRFQASHGIPQVGQVGPMTWRALLTKSTTSRAAVTKTAPATVRRVPTSVTAGRVCPAPGAAFGQGFGAARTGHSHQGMDLAGRRGSQILAVESGVVIREGRQPNGALRIVLQGVSGAKFFYGHMSSDLVHAGQRVTRGLVIGLMGDSGSPGAVHLHFEFWRSGGESDAIDPAPLLRLLCS